MATTFTRLTTFDDVFNTEEERKTKILIYRLQDVTRDYE